jgi:transposase InsO family protein
MGKMFLVIVDAHSKWLEVLPANQATSTVTIEKLRGTFVTFGLPEMIVSDNGTAFTSKYFQEFTQVNGIVYTKTAPYHPASNGLAERAVQTFKEGTKKMVGGSVECKLFRFLLKYRVTPQATTGVSPSELMSGRRLRTHLDLLRPNLGSKVRQNQARQKKTHDYHVKF